ncbi:hypothetical protein E2K73_07120 [Acinetobacter sp. RF15A]|nr:hypothetical protein E2K52_02945 [Acinetobacter sp. RF14B]TSH75861.1 hypothetical protein E2K73_07120 [Acinetobacter sp. RF15A]TSI17500.1 hypothetical protein E2K74_08790 [Acinetobacter sp. RF15B]
MSTHNVLSYAKRIDEICLGEWWQSRAWFKHDLSNTRAVLMICLSITCGFSPTCLGCIFGFIRFDLKSKYV